MSPADAAWQVAAVQLVLVFACARLLELVGSALRAAAARIERGVRPVREPWWPAIVLVHALVLGGSLAAALLAPRRPPNVVLAATLVALSVATALRLWLFVTLRGRWNVRVVDPGTIATGGPYRYIRHPNYLAVILEVAALPLFAGAWALAVLASAANALVLSRRIPLEERTLAGLHPVYRDVLMRRPRFIPRAPGS